MSDYDKFPATPERDGDLEASSGFTNQERIVAGMEDPEHASGYYWSEHDDFDDEENEDPLEGQTNEWVHPDETRTDEQIEFDEKYAVEPWDPEQEAKEYDEYVSMEDEYKKPCINPYMLTLEQTVKERALAQGISEEDAAKVYSATFVIKDIDGNPTDTLKANFSYYKGPISRPGVQSFQLHPIDGPKDEYGRDKKFVDGFFGSSHRLTGLGAFSMTYAGGDKAAWQYAHKAIQPETLATADLVELKVPEQQD